MSQKFPSTMLDEEGGAPTDEVAAVEAELDRLAGLVENVEAHKKRCYPQKEGDPPPNPKTIASIMDSKLGVTESCGDWLIDKVLPALSSSAAVQLVRDALAGIREGLLVQDLELQRFCDTHKLERDNL